MTDLNYLLILVGIFWFYWHDFKKFYSHMSILGIALYSTLKALTMLTLPFVSMLFASNILELSESSTWTVVAGTFLITFGVITLVEDKKIGIIYEEIKKARDDLEK